MRGLGQRLSALCRRLPGIRGLCRLISRLRLEPAPSYRPLFSREAVVRDLQEHDPEYERVRRVHEDALRVARVARNGPIEDQHWDDVRAAEIGFRRRRLLEGQSDAGIF